MLLVAWHYQKQCTKESKGDWDVDQWKSAGLACARSWIQSQAERDGGDRRSGEGEWS